MGVLVRKRGAAELAEAVGSLSHFFAYGLFRGKWKKGSAYLICVCPFAWYFYYPFHYLIPNPEWIVNACIKHGNSKLHQKDTSTEMWVCYFKIRIQRRKMVWGGVCVRMCLIKQDICMNQEGKLQCINGMNGHSSQMPDSSFNSQRN